MQTRLEGERLARYKLIQVEGLGPVRLRALLETFGSAETVWAASNSQLATINGIGSKTIAHLREWQNSPRIDVLCEEMARLGVEVILEGEDRYPVRLAEIPDPPAAFTLLGDITEADERAVAVVGSRRASHYGLRMAEKLARGLAENGVTVVSGLARGIDGVAHRAALDAGGRTIAVLASGLGRIYPPEHEELAQRIMAAGCLISEAPVDGAPIGELFPRRNRIISGLSLAVVIIEAAERSGALSTAYHAIDQNRDVFAVPGRADDPTSAGTSALLKKGAYLATSVADILEQLPPKPHGLRSGQANPLGASNRTGRMAPESGPPSEFINELTEEDTELGLSPSIPPGLPPLEAAIWPTLGDDPVSLEQILERTGLRASEASTALLMLEMKKHVRRLPGNCYVLVR